MNEKPSVSSLTVAMGSSGVESGSFDTLELKFRPEKREPEAAGPSLGLYVS